MNSKQQKTLARIFERPTRSDLAWSEVESLFKALGAEIQEGNGSRIRVKLNRVKSVFHKPHPHPQIKKYAVEDIRDFLQEAGVNYE
jgi:hypothetical protein